MLNFGASKPRVGGARAPGPPPDPHLTLLSCDSLSYVDLFVGLVDNICT